MAADETVDTGSFSIASKVDKNFALNVSTSMSLSLPDHFADHPTAENLRHQVKAGALWLTRARSCRLSLEIHFEHPGISVHEGGKWREFAIDAFQSSPVWRDLGLELRQELNVLQSNRTRSATSVFHIQHTRQNAGLFVPQYVPCGYISEISCSFRFADTTPVPQTRAHTRYALRKLDGARSEACSAHAAAIWDLSVDVQAERVVHLSDNALNLVLGMKRRCLGIRCLEGTKSLELLELAPAVWNSQYFQNIVTRARLIPAISTTLGNMLSTQSSVLRRKIESLVAEPPQGSGLEDVSDELHRRTQILLLRTTRDQKIKAYPLRSKSQSANICGFTEDPPLPNASTSNDYNNYTSPDYVREPLHGQEDGQSHETMSGFSDDCLAHLESESSYGSAIYQAVSAEGHGDNLRPGEDYMDSSMYIPGWIDDDMVSLTSEGLLEPGSLHHEHCVGDGVLDLAYSEQEYRDQRLGHHDFHQDDLYDESNIYGNYYEMSGIERLQPIVHGFEDYSVQSDRATGRLQNPGDECSDLIGDENDAIDEDVYERLHDTYFDEGEDEPWEINQDHQSDMLHGDDVESEAGPDYITAAHVHDNDHTQAVESNTRLGWGGQVLEDWSQLRWELCVPRR